MRLPQLDESHPECLCLNTGLFEEFCDTLPGHANPFTNFSMGQPLFTELSDSLDSFAISVEISYLSLPSSVTSPLLSTSHMTAPPWRTSGRAAPSSAERLRPGNKTGPTKGTRPAPVGPSSSRRS